MIEQMTVGELRALLDEKPEDFTFWQVVDVREPWEVERGDSGKPCSRGATVSNRSMTLDSFEPVRVSN